MKIRMANNADQPQIIRLVKTVLREFGFDYAPESSEADLQNIEDHYLRLGGVFLLMENNEQELIATGALKRLEEGSFKIRKMYVAKPHRGKGYGKDILIRLLEIAQKEMASIIILETSSSMLSAINLYKSHGFEMTDEKPDSPRCDISMTKKLNAR
ncbi:MAG: GNAT family N-acetyltransferase [Ekhidna sp.]